MNFRIIRRVEAHDAATVLQVDPGGGADAEDACQKRWVKDLSERPKERPILRCGDRSLWHGPGQIHKVQDTPFD